MVSLALICAYMVELPRVSCSGAMLHTALVPHAMLPVGLRRNGAVPLTACCCVQSCLGTVPAGIMAAAPLTQKKLSDHTYMIVGEGRAATHIAEMITVGHRMLAHAAGSTHGMSWPCSSLLLALLQCIAQSSDGQLVPSNPNFCLVVGRHHPGKPPCPGDHCAGSKADVVGGL